MPLSLLVSYAKDPGLNNRDGMVALGVLVLSDTGTLGNQTVDLPWSIDRNKKQGILCWLNGLGFGV